MTKQRRQETAARLLIPLALLLVFILLGLTYGYYYAVNDDISMRGIVAGGYMGRPDGHSIFINYVLGAALAELFRLQSRIDWYGLMMIGGAWLCLTLIILRVRRCCAGRKHAGWLFAAAVIGLALCFARHVLFFQFTTFSGLLAGTAVFLLLTRGEDERFGSYLIPVVLLWLSALVRRNVFFMFLPISSLVVCCDLLRLLRTKPANWKRAAVRPLAAALLLALLFAGSEHINKEAYSAPEWQEYISYRSSRSRILDYNGFPPYEGYEERWAEIGVTEEEREVIMAFGILPDIDAEKLGKIAALSRSMDVESGTFEKIHDMLSLLKASALKQGCREQNLLLVLAFALVVLLWKRLGAEEKLLVVFGVLAELGILLYLLNMGRLPTRVIAVFDWCGILCALGVALRLAADGRLGAVRAERNAALLAALVLLLGAVPFAAALEKERSNYRENLKLYTAYSSDQNDPEHFYVCATSAVTTVKQFTLIDTSEEDALHNSCGTRGWSSRMPLLEERKRLYGIERDDHIFLADGVIFVDADTMMAEAFDRYFHSLGIDASHEIIKTVVLPNGKEILQIRWTGPSSLGNGKP